MADSDIYYARLHFILSLHKLSVVNIVLSREADAEERVHPLQLMNLKCRLRLSNGESCLQAPIHIFNMLCEGGLETAQGDGSLGLTLLTDVFSDLIHIRPVEAASCLANPPFSR